MSVKEGSKLVTGVVVRRRIMAGLHVSELCVAEVVASLSCHLLSEESGITKQSIGAVA